MKKLLAIILSVLMILSLSACRKSKAPDDLYDFLDDDYQANQSESDSVSDAAIDFHYFIEECYKNCPYKEVHKGVNDDNF